MTSVLAEPSRAAHADEAACLRERLEHCALTTSRLSHDFGNYLTGIMGFTELSLSQASADSLSHRFLSEVLESAKQGAEWIRRLHLFCRRGASPPWPALLSSVLVHTEKAVRAAGMASMRWQTGLPGDLPLLAIDAGALQTALTELVNNAREATEDRGAITFAARVAELTEGDCLALFGPAQAGQYVEITVSDDGPGVAADVWPRLFRDIFCSTKPRHRGLGLLVVYGILHRCGGGLKLDEPAANRGATVRLYVPIVAVAGPALAAAAAPPRVLLAHTNALLYDSMRRILQARGCVIESADTSAAALAVYAASTGAEFDLVVTDTVLSHMTGFELARRILDQHPHANFLFVHTQASFHGLPEEESLKRFDLLRWPMSPPALVEAVRTALARTAQENRPAKGQ